MFAQVRRRSLTLPLPLPLMLTVGFCSAEFTRRRAYVLGAMTRCVWAHPHSLLSSAAWGERAEAALRKAALLSEWLMSAFYDDGPHPLAPASVYCQLVTNTRAQFVGGCRLNAFGCVAYRRRPRPREADIRQSIY